MGCELKRAWVAVMLAAAFGVAGCPDADPCGLCPEGHICVEPDWECREECTPGSPGTSTCQAGQKCLPTTHLGTPTGVCSLCQQELCSAGEECVGDVCRPVECGTFVACPRSTDFCDPFVNDCYPGNGACRSVEDCPRFDGSAASAGQLACREGFCRLDPRPPPYVPGLEAPAEVELLSPRHGSQFPSLDTFQIVWNGPRADAIVLILTQLPQTREGMLSLAVWGASIPAGQPTELRVEDGVELIDGVWSSQHSASLPQDTPLYVLIQLVEGEKLLAISPLVPFIVGRSWREPGDTCTLSTDCENPRYVQGCLEGRCRVLCASNRDCLPWSQTCTWPEEGLRYCR